MNSLTELISYIKKCYVKIEDKSLKMKYEIACRSTNHMHNCIF